jgi:hypothetical protein
LLALHLIFSHRASLLNVVPNIDIFQELCKHTSYFQKLTMESRTFVIYFSGRLKLTSSMSHTSVIASVSLITDLCSRQSHFSLSVLHINSSYMYITSTSPISLPFYLNPRVSGILSFKARPSCIIGLCPAEPLQQLQVTGCFATGSVGPFLGWPLLTRILRLHWFLLDLLPRASLASPACSPFTSASHF